MKSAWWQSKRTPLLTRGGISLNFDPRDTWFGVFWDSRDGVTQIFICIIPCLPIRIVKKG